MKMLNLFSVHHDIKINYRWFEALALKLNIHQEKLKRAILTNFSIYTKLNTNIQIKPIFAFAFFSS